jgi:hypothetical protein
VKAAIVTQPNQTPTYDALGDPAAQNGFELITVTASALFPLTKSRAAGSHYSSPDTFPMVVGVDGVGITCTGNGSTSAQLPFPSLTSTRHEHRHREIAGCLRDEVATVKASRQRDIAHCVQGRVTTLDW